MLQFANDQIAARLGKLAFEVRRASKARDAEAIHDLRVAIRRFTQSLTVFGSLVPERDAAKIHKRLGRIMDDAGRIRDRDIAIEFLREAGVPPDHPLWKRLSRERAAAERDLLDRIERWNQKNVSGKWRAALRLNVS